MVENEIFIMCFSRVVAPKIWLRFDLLFFIVRHKTIKVRATCSTIISCRSRNNGKKFEELIFVALAFDVA